jgi:hypothetical protein
MSYQQMVLGADQSGSVTAVAGTAITQPTTRKRGCKTTLDTATYTAAGTAHTLTVMRDIGRTKVTSDAAAAQTSVVLDADPGPTGNGLAAGDHLIFIKPDGLPHLGVVSTWTPGTKTVVLTANVPTGGFAKGADVFNYGVPADTDPATGSPHFALTQGAGATTVNNNATGNGLVDSFRNGAPLLLHSNNATAAGTLNRARWLFTLAPAAPGTSGLLASGRKDVDDSPEDGPAE